MAVAQTYPSRPITIIVPTTAGTSADTLGRVLAERMRQSLGQPVIIENVSGADGTIGVAQAARAQPDGYTIHIGYKATILNGAFYSLAYDVLNYFAPIAPLATAPYVLFARRAVPAKDLSELIAWLKANPNRASAGISAGSGHLITAFFQKETGTQFTLVPYRGGAQAMQDLAAGQIDLVFQTADQLPLMRASAVKAYAVTGTGRLAIASDIPTFDESGMPAAFWSSWYAWYGLFARSGTPRETVSRLTRRQWTPYPVR
jgi:tripartite-type tricarboxylate transporter receptor subunit TctC